MVLLLLLVLFSMFIVWVNVSVFTFVFILELPSVFSCCKDVLFNNFLLWDLWVNLNFFLDILFDSILLILIILGFLLCSAKFFFAFFSEKQFSVLLFDIR